MQIAQLFFHNTILIASRTTDFWCFLKELAGLHRILIDFCDLFRKILLKREKTARIIQKAAYKNRQHDFFRLPALICLSHQRRFSCFFLWCQWIRMPTLHSLDWKEKKQQESIRKLQKNRQHDSFACLLWYVRAVKDVFHVSVCDTSESSANAAQLRLKSEKSTRINQKTAQKQAARFFRLPALICSSRQRLFPCFFLWCQRIKPPATAIKIRMPTTNAVIFQLPSHKLLPIFTINAIAGNRAIVVRKNNGSGGIVLLKATMYVRASFGKPGHKNNRNTMRSIFRRFVKKENRSRCSSFTKRFKSGRPIHCTR